MRANHQGPFGRNAEPIGDRPIDLTLTRSAGARDSEAPIPGRILVVRSDSQKFEDQLFIDRVPISPSAWSYDAHDRVLRWTGLFGGGQIHLNHDGLGGSGIVGDTISGIGVRAGATATFACDVALDVGASSVTSGGDEIGFAWDATSPAWRSASWEKNRLTLSYTVNSAGEWGPGTTTLQFEDNLTGEPPWQPDLSDQSTLEAVQGESIQWELNLTAVVVPDDPGAPAGSADSVFPTRLQALEDAFATQIQGVMRIDGDAPEGTLVGIDGRAPDPNATGYFVAVPGKAPFGVFGGGLSIGGQTVAASTVHGSVLSWAGLESNLQERTGLPERGRLRLGSTGPKRGTIRAVRPLTANEAAAAITEHHDLHPQVASALNDLPADGSLNMPELLAMTPFGQNAAGEWADQVQSAVTGDLSEIMNSFVPSDLWSLLFGDEPQPALTGELAAVAGSPVEGVDDPESWYLDLSTAIMTQGLSGGSDDNCANLNGPRAGAWVQSEVATSKVYHAHGQLLFAYRWAQRWPRISLYLQDQITNASSYEGEITTQTQAVIADIQANVSVDPTVDPDPRPQMEADVQAAGQYAITNQLYWAFRYFTYATDPQLLANIAAQMSGSTGSGDGTVLPRLLQQNMTVLTALDGSGFFAQKYVDVINAFMATNVLPNMFGFGDAMDIDVIKQYLNTFVNNNLANEDAQIAAAAAQIKALLDDDQADAMLQASVEALQAFSSFTQDALALPYVANKFVAWFTTNYPKSAAAAETFGSLLIGGVAALGVMNLIGGFRDWKSLTDVQRTEVINNAVQLGLQVVSAVVKRGVRIYAIFGEEGLTAAQQAASAGRILINGEGGALEQALARTGNTMARWLSSSEGTATINVTTDGEMSAIMINEEAVAAEDATWAATVFGKNMSEFVATRAGAVLIVAGIVVSLVAIADGDSGMAEVGDALSVVSGGLTLIAMASSWAVTGGYVLADSALATVLSAAGPLAILAALAGIGIMIYEMFKKPPDPVKEFVDDYAKPAGLYVEWRSSSLDYATGYLDPSNLLRVGFTLSIGSQALICNADGSLSTGPSVALPPSVWQVITDGSGVGKIFTVAPQAETGTPEVVLLSLMSDGTVRFAPQAAPPTPPPAVQSPQPVSQRWSAGVTSAAKLIDATHVAAMTLTLTCADSPGGSLSVDPNGAVTIGDPTVLTLTMSGMGPNYMTMKDLKFIENSTPSTDELFGPTFGVPPSPPTYTLSPAAEGLPPFLQFDPVTGRIKPNGQPATAAFDQKFSITAWNTALGLSATASFELTVAAQ